MASDEWQGALAGTLAEPDPCFMCAETLWSKCHRRLIAELLDARGYEVRHLIRPGRTSRTGSGTSPTSATATSTTAASLSPDERPTSGV